MEYGCKGKNVCITGGTSGIGLATARAFVRDGARVLVTGRDADKGAHVIRELKGLTGFEPEKESQITAFFPTDISTHAGCEKLATAVQDFFGRDGLDILVTCAGVYQEKFLAALTLADYEMIMNTNVAGTLWTVQALLPLLNEGSSVVTVGSDAGVSGNYGCPLYCASKGAVVAMTRALALDLAPRIRVNCVCPGDVDTPLVQKQLARAGGSYTEADMAAAYPVGRIGKPEEIAHMICAVASPANNFMTGSVIMIDGGLTAK